MTKPTVVCLCGSTRFMEMFQKANLEETLAGNIVLSIGCDTKSADQSPLFDVNVQDSYEVAVAKVTKKKELDELHLRKIDLADEVLILNVGGYIGESTGDELRYARRMKKKVRSLVRLTDMDCPKRPGSTCNFDFDMLGDPHADSCLWCMRYAERWEWP